MYLMQILLMVMLSHFWNDSLSNNTINSAGNDVLGDDLYDPANTTVSLDAELEELLRLL